MGKSFSMIKRAIALGCTLGLALALAGTPATAQSSTTGTTKKAPAGQTTKAPAKPGAAKPAAKPADAPVALTTDKQKMSYALGMSLGANLRAQAVDVDPAVMLQGIKDAIAGTKMAMTEDEMKAAINKLQADLRVKQEAKRKEMEESRKLAGEANKKDGESFLAANKSKPGVVTLPSGLQYKIITEGTGPKPAATDKVVCNYRGTLINGTEFDASEKHGGPATFPVTGVIKAWTEALQLMPVGSKWQLFIPSELGYGERGAGGDIGPNSVLIFDVELVSIVPKEDPKAAPQTPPANPEPKTPPPPPEMKKP